MADEGVENLEFRPPPWFKQDPESRVAGICFHHEPLCQPVARSLVELRRRRQPQMAEEVEKEDERLSVEEWNDSIDRDTRIVAWRDKKWEEEEEEEEEKRRNKERMRARQESGDNIRPRRSERIRDDKAQLKRLECLGPNDTQPPKLHYSSKPRWTFSSSPYNLLHLLHPLINNQGNPAVELTMRKQQSQLVLNDLLSPEASLRRGGSGNKADGNKTVSELLGKHVLLLFATASCFEAEAFLPVLKRMYEMSSPNECEIIYLSLDCEEIPSSFTESIERMPWFVHHAHAQDYVVYLTSLLFGDPLRFPAVVAFGPTGHLITKESNLALKEDVGNPMYLFIKASMEEDVKRD